MNDDTQLCVIQLLLFELKVKLYQYYLTEKKVYYSKNKQDSFTKRWQKYRPLFDNWNHFLYESGRESCLCGGICIYVYI